MPSSHAFVWDASRKRAIWRATSVFIAASRKGLVSAPSPRSATERAGPGIDHRLNDRDRSRNGAQCALNAGDQQRSERHPVGHGRKCRPKAVGFGQCRAERPGHERVRLRRERALPLSSATLTSRTGTARTNTVLSG